MQLVYSEGRFRQANPSLSMNRMLGPIEILKWNLASCLFARHRHGGCVLCSSRTIRNTWLPGVHPTVEYYDQHQYWALCNPKMMLSVHDIELLPSSQRTSCHPLAEPNEKREDALPQVSWVFTTWFKLCCTQCQICYSHSAKKPSTAATAHVPGASGSQNLLVYTINSRRGDIANLSW